MKQAAEHGSNPMWTLRNSQWRRPLRTASWIMIIAALMVLYATYNIKNAKRIKARGGGWKNGLKCLSEDIKNLPMAFMVWRKSYMMKELGEVGLIGKKLRLLVVDVPVLPRMTRLDQGARVVVVARVGARRVRLARGVRKMLLQVVLQWIL